MHLLSWTEGRLCLRELVLPEARLLFGVFRRQSVLDVPIASTPGQGSGFGFTADPGRARALDDGLEGRLGARARAVDRL